MLREKSLLGPQYFKTRIKDTSFEKTSISAHLLQEVCTSLLSEDASKNHQRWFPSSARTEQVVTWYASLG
jgi:hypothetical protein